MAVKIAEFFAHLYAKDDLTPGLKKAKGGMADFSSVAKTALMGVGAMAAAAGIAIKKSIDETIDYADAVRTLNQVNGQSAETNSRLIQTLDDYKVGVEDIVTAQRKLATQQETLNIPTLARLSDEYLKLNTGAERQAFLTENFGRASAAWAEVMAQGSKAIQDRANSISRSLILDQAAIDKAREYQYQLDDLNDTFGALKLAVGQKALPIVIDLITKFTSQVGKPDSFVNREIENITTSLGLMSGELSVIDTKMQWGKWGPEIVKVAGDTERWTKALSLAKQAMADESVNRRIVYSAEALNQRAQAIYNLLEGANKNAVPLIQTGKGIADAWSSAHKGISGAKTALEEIVDYERQLSNILSFSDTYSSGIEDIAQAQEDLNKAYQELNDIKKKNPWDAAGIKAAEDNVLQYKKRIEEAKKASQDATNEMIAQWLAVGLAQDGAFTTDDMQKVLEFRKQMGLLSDVELKAAIDALERADKMIRGLPDKDVHIRVYTDNMGWTSSGASGETGGVTIANPYEPGSAQWEKWNKSHGKPSYASGGSFRGWAMVGDKPGGGITPYTEYVYAPNGATVYNQRQMAGQGAPSMAMGGVIQPQAREVNITINNPLAETSEESISRELLKLNYLGVLQ